MERCLLNDLLWMLALQFQLCIKYKMIHIFLFSRNFDAMLNGLKLPCRRKGFRTTKCRGAGENLPRPLDRSGLFLYTMCLCCGAAVFAAGTFRTLCSYRLRTRMSGINSANIKADQVPIEHPVSPPDPRAGAS